MKKTFLLLICMLVCCIAVFAQSVTLTFTAKDAANQYVQLNRVVITNLTKNWQETIYWPDTTLTMQNGTGIGDVETHGRASLQLSQNNPNPFTGTTEVSLMVAEDDEVMLDITDVNGKIVGTHRMRPQTGIHQFRITLSTAGTYIMTARQNGQTSSIKMVCNGGGDVNKIEYVGNGGDASHASATQPKNAPKYTTTHPFNFGDQMEYVGYATINGNEVESQIITQTQGTSQTFTLQFAEMQYQLPTVITSAASNITLSSATVGGSVISDGGITVIARGVCWSTSQNPTVSDSYTIDGNGMGSFTSSITGLTGGTTYYVRAYAINAQGTAYGNEMVFTTIDPCNGAALVMDIDGNVYNTVGIGNQCWMKENLRTTHYANGEYIPMDSVYSYTNPYRYNPDTSASNVPAYGYLYNWPAVMHGATSDYACQGICPYGWHVPSYAEWAQLINYVGNQTQYQCGNNSDNIAKALASTTGWRSSSATCAVGNNPSANNATGFSALPAGVYNLDYYDGYTCSSFGQYTAFWSATPSSANSAIYNSLNYYEAYVYTDFTWGEKCLALSVRCVRNEGGSSTGQIPTVTTSSISSITAYTATCGGNVTDDGGASVTARGVCWSTSQNPTINDSHTMDGSGIGSFTSSITGLTAEITYYVRAYAMNSVGISYGEQQFFTTTSLPTINLPTVSTSMVSNISTSSATCGGNITDDGGATVTARGVCWSTSQNPTINDNYTVNGSGTGSFSSSMTGLSAETTYYVCAYATNSVGTSYGAQQIFTTMSLPTITLPTVSTSMVSNISPYSATCGGNVTNDGGATVTARGVCWSTSQNPTINSSYLTIDGSGIGIFISSITSLTPGTTYYVRAYATNAVGTAYGDNAIFTAIPSPVGQDGQPCPDAATVTDVDGNVYNTVQIGNQCWMKENLRTTRYANGVNIPMGSTYSYFDPYRYAPDNNNSNVSTYGYLYNWAAVMNGDSSSFANPSGVQGICPNGWHVPSDAEWTQLTNYVGSQTQYRCDNSSGKIAKALASTTGWLSSDVTCEVGNNPSTNNATGFSALPAGVYDGYYYNLGSYAYFWSATENFGGYVYDRNLNYDNANVYRDYDDNYYGFSVRCVRD